MIRHLSIAAALVLAATPALAQQNKPVRSGTYYEDRASGSNSGTNILYLKFAQVPSDKFFNITNVSCELDVTVTQPTLTLASLRVGTTSGSNDIGRSFAISGGLVRSTPSFNGGYLHALNNNALFLKVGPGRYPTIFLNALQTSGAPNMSANCQIVGTLSDD